MRTSSLTRLGSLLEQDYPADRYEIVVLHDGSTDGAPGVDDELATAQQQPQMRLARRPPKNQNAARSLGVSTTRGSLVAFLDDDEVAPRNWLSGVVEGHERHPQADVVGGPNRVRFESGPPVCANAAGRVKGNSGGGTKRAKRSTFQVGTCSSRDRLLHASARSTSPSRAGATKLNG